MYKLTEVIAFCHEVLTGKRAEEDFNKFLEEVKIKSYIPLLTKNMYIDMAISDLEELNISTPSESAIEMENLYPLHSFLNNIYYNISFYPLKILSMN